MTIERKSYIGIRYHKDSLKRDYEECLKYRSENGQIDFEAASIHLNNISHGKESEAAFLKAIQLNDKKGYHVLTVVPHCLMKNGKYDQMKDVEIFIFFPNKETEKNILLSKIPFQIKKIDKNGKVFFNEKQLAFYNSNRKEENKIITDGHIDPFSAEGFLLFNCIYPNIRIALTKTEKTSDDINFQATVSILRKKPLESNKNIIHAETQYSYSIGECLEEETNISGFEKRKSFPMKFYVNPHGFSIEEGGDPLNRNAHSSANIWKWWFALLCDNLTTNTISSYENELKTLFSYDIENVEFYNKMKNFHKTDKIFFNFVRDVLSKISKKIIKDQRYSSLSKEIGHLLRKIKSFEMEKKNERIN